MVWRDDAGEVRRIGTFRVELGVGGLELFQERILALAGNESVVWRYAGLTTMG
jgi:hypothetical protein